MGCCQMRNMKMDEDFNTVQICFVENNTQQTSSPVDKIVYRYINKQGS